MRTQSEWGMPPPPPGAQGSCCALVQRNVILCMNEFVECPRAPCAPSGLQHHVHHRHAGDIVGVANRDNCGMVGGCWGVCLCASVENTSRLYRIQQQAGGNERAVEPTLHGWKKNHENYGYYFICDRERSWGVIPIHKTREYAALKYAAHAN